MRAYTLMMKNSQRRIEITVMARNPDAAIAAAAKRCPQERVILVMARVA